jgi:hypothetical protein
VKKCQEEQGYRGFKHRREFLYGLIIVVNIYMISFNWNHLSVAKQYATVNFTGLKLYFWHFKVSIVESLWLFALGIASVLHAILPFLFDFDLMKIRVEGIKRLKTKFPQDPTLQTIEFKK